MIVTKSLYWIRSQLAGWWKSLPAFTGKTHKHKEKDTTVCHRQHSTQHTGRQSWLRSPGWSWTDQAGRSSGSSTRAPRWPDHHTGRQGRHQTLNATPGSFGELHRLPSQAVRRQIIQTKQGQTFGFQERQFGITLYRWFHRAGSLEKFWFQSNFTIVTDCNVINFPICQPI